MRKIAISHAEMRDEHLACNNVTTKTVSDSHAIAAFLTFIFGKAYKKKVLIPHMKYPQTPPINFSSCCRDSL
jgi:hypothetical protein